MKGADLIRLSAAAEALGPVWTSQRLRRYLLRRERETGRTILVRVGEGDDRPTYLVALRAVRRHCPELFDRHDEAQAAVVGVLGKVMRRVDSIETKLDDVKADQGSIARVIGSSVARRR